jgi:protein-tyrosine phosphatase
MARIVSWHDEIDGQLDQALLALDESRLVALPTEAGYVLAASVVRPEAVRRLERIAAISPSPLALALRDQADVEEWVTGFGPIAWRLARRCWPGPLTLVVDSGSDNNLASRLPDEVRQCLAPSGRWHLRMPNHEVFQRIVERLPGPLALANHLPPEATPEDLAQHLGDDLDLILESDCIVHGGLTTVRVEGNRWSIVAEGAIPGVKIQECSSCQVVFVCTGNTCRSPLAEALCKKLLADRLGCSVEELPGRGFLVHSAGLSAMLGEPAAQEAVEVARTYGADLGGHCSRPATREILLHADYLMAMTQGHLQVLQHLSPAGGSARLLSPEGADIPDPIGGNRPVYEDCAQQIWYGLQRLLEELSPAECGSGEAGPR